MQKERQGEADNPGPPDTFATTWGLEEVQQQEARVKRISLVKALGFEDGAVLEEVGPDSEDDMTLRALQKKMSEEKTMEAKQQEQQRMMQEALRNLQREPSAKTNRKR